MIASVPKDSVLWPIAMGRNIWWRASEGTTLFGFTDDLAMVVFAKHPEDVELHKSKATVSNVPLHLKIWSMLCSTV